MSGSGQRRVRWNLALLQDGLAPALARLMLELREPGGPSSHYWGYVGEGGGVRQ